jgi:LysM repeat protein
VASNIGIKIANGEFYPLIEENSSTKKRLVLTTVHDNQPSVQIDLFRSPENVMVDAQYIGTVVVENIKPKPSGEPSIEMVVSSDIDGNIIADAIDLDSGPHGEHYVLTVSLKSIDETSRDMEIPDFELESNEEPPSGLFNYANKIWQYKRFSPKLWIIILIALFLVLGLLAWLFFFRGVNDDRSSPDRAAAAQVVQQEPQAPPQIIPPEPASPEPVLEAQVRQPEPVLEAPLQVRQPEPVQQIIQPPPVIAAPVTAPPPRQVTPANRRTAPVWSYNVPAVIPREGVNYTIRSGDTLWDISEAFYRDPWLYPRIAQHNNIRNANLIISGRTIRIPPRN